MGFYHSIVLQAPIEEVWKTVGNFYDLAWAEPVLTKLQKVGDVPGNQAGAKRLLNDQYLETLTSYDENRFTFSYVTENIPTQFSNATVTDFHSTLRLLPVTSDNFTFVELSASYQSDRPESVEKLGDPIYEALLLSLKKKVER